MLRLLKLFFYLAIFIGLGVVGYAIFAELPPPTKEVSVPIGVIE